MYLPEHFRETDKNEIKRIVNDFPLATLITTGSSGLLANHIPFLVDFNKDGSSKLLGHVAIENEIFKENKDGDDVLVVYKAEDTYISPNWYPTKKKTHEVVPTWNYQSVHFYGKINFVKDKKTLLRIVGKLTKIYEKQIGEKNPWKIKDAPKDFISRKLTNIVGIQITINKTMAKSKLNQNKELGDIIAVKAKMLEKNKKSLYFAMKDKKIF